MTVERISVEDLARLPAFSHATVAGDFIYVSGTLGAAEGSMRLVDGGVAAETEQTLRNIEKILAACGADFADLVKVNVFLSDMSRFGEMNEVYLRIIGPDGPARITVGRAELALGAAVEIDCVAYRPRRVAFDSARA